MYVFYYKTYKRILKEKRLSFWEFKISKLSFLHNFPLLQNDFLTKKKYIHTHTHTHIYIYIYIPAISAMKPYFVSS